MLCLLRKKIVHSIGYSRSKSSALSILGLDYIDLIKTNLPASTPTAFQNC